MATVDQRLAYCEGAIARLLSAITGGPIAAGSTATAVKALAQGGAAYPGVFTVAPHQRGARLGHIRYLELNDASIASAVSMTATSYRHNDPNKNAILDNLGLVQGMSRIATVAIPFTAGQASSANVVQIVTSGSVSYTLSRQQTVFIIGALVATYSVPAGSDSAALCVDPQAPVSAPASMTKPQAVLVGSAAPPPYQTVTLWQVKTLAAGTYTAAWEWYGTANGNSLQISSGQLDVFLIGG